MNPTMTSAATGERGRPETSVVVANLVRFLETGSIADGLFAPDVFAATCASYSGDRANPSARSISSDRVGRSRRSQDWANYSTDKH